MDPEGPTQQKGELWEDDSENGKGEDTMKNENHPRTHAKNH